MEAITRLVVVHKWRIAPELVVGPRFARTQRSAVSVTVLDCNLVLHTDEVKSGLAKFAAEIDPISMGDLARLLASESERWKAIVQATGFTPIE